MSTMASQINSLTIVNTTVYSQIKNKQTTKLRVTGLWAGNSPVTGEFPAQRVSNAENVSFSIGVGGGVGWWWWWGWWGGGGGGGGGGVVVVGGGGGGGGGVAGGGGGGCRNWSNTANKENLDSSH